jgi:hypothetical protein
MAALTTNSDKNCLIADAKQQSHCAGARIILL